MYPTIYMLCVAGKGGVGLCWRPSTAGIHTLYVAKFRFYKIAWPPHDKSLGGEEAFFRKINRVLFQVTFKAKRHCIALGVFSFYAYNDKNYGIEKKILPLACMVVAGCPPHSWYKCTFPYCCAWGWRSFTRKKFGRRGGKKGASIGPR
jgi:hypothetical protein